MPAAVVLAGVLGLAACGGSTEGGDQTVRTSDRGAAPDGKSDTPLANTDPCSLLKPADVPELSQKSGAAAKTVGRWCQGSGYGIFISEVDLKGYFGLFKNPTVKPIPDIAGYPAGTIEVAAPGASTCAVLLAVTTHEVVTVTADTCDIGTKAATAIAGRIPR
ncbi:DUF3558 domain-containing protein [Amycolatopsis sp. GA6-003]|uniref:DUF3558 domain-containing protein n=1 Tax=Amycolatopsis sp. GA6-003 TaxID=2652444 RepID=UPI00391750BA